MTYSKLTKNAAGSTLCPVSAHARSDQWLPLETTDRQVDRSGFIILLWHWLNPERGGGGVERVRDGSHTVYIQSIM